MTDNGRMHLAAFMRPISIHTGAWRYPGGTPDANFNFPLIVKLAQRLEEARFDAFFMADHLAMLNMPMDALKRSARPPPSSPSPCCRPCRWRPRISA